SEEPTPSHKIFCPPSGITFPHDVPRSGSKTLTYVGPSGDHMGRYDQTDDPESKYFLDSLRPAGASAVSPRIEITPSHELIHSGGTYHSREGEILIEHPSNSATTSPRFTLPVPGYETNPYREPPCLSPASSGSSASFISETNYSPYTSPCVSPNNGHGDDLCPQFQNINTNYSPRTSPAMSPHTSIPEDNGLGPRSPSPRPGSRSSSPGAKRRFSCTEQYPIQQTSPRQSRTSSPQASPHTCLREDNASMIFNQFPCSSALTDAMNSLSTESSCSIPKRIFINSDSSPAIAHVFQEGFLGSCEQDIKMKPGSESILLVPPSWPKHIMPHFPLNRYSIPVASLPSLEWPLLSESGPYELRIEVQPKPHHRAHYETEGSRGAVKAPTGGHPIVQLHGYMENKPLILQIFIGTADERILKPHAFYQVHRITGKTVTTTSYEQIIGNTKVLEIPLEPKNKMRAIIDCAGILKLRNADIELRKGETDIGRKNTRVRLVFRVHISEPSGRIISLQVASNPIECSQRSAHELPMVESQDIVKCLVFGGQQMILTGQNFTSESKVVFVEKAPDGQQVWEVEATVDKNKCQSNMLFVEIPEYRNKRIRTPVKVNFYVINGKRKRSQPQHFTYLPVPSIKTEPIDVYEPTLVCSTVHGGLGTMPQSYYSQQAMVNTESTSCLVAGMSSCQQVPSGLSPPESRYQQQSPTAVIYPASKLGYHQSPLMSSQILTSPDLHRSVLVHAGSPVQSSTLLHHSPTNQESSPSIHYSPVNPQLRCGSHQEFQHIMYCENFAHGSTARPTHPQISQAQKISPSQYPTVIHQQSTIQRAAKNGPPTNVQKHLLPTGVTIKQEENLDQAYLDDVMEMVVSHQLQWLRYTI
uniref:Nuclear factor of activated T cells 2 n=1 Tax=Latimeria chalumnae TaxID=7897 RepID=H3AWK5_LATCH